MTQHHILHAQHRILYGQRGGVGSNLDNLDKLDKEENTPRPTYPRSSTRDNPQGTQNLPSFAQKHGEESAPRRPDAEKAPPRFVPVDPVLGASRLAETKAAQKRDAQAMSAGGGAHGGARVNAADIKLNVPNNTGAVYFLHAVGAANFGEGIMKSEAGTPPDCPPGCFELDAPGNQGEINALSAVGIINICGARPACASNVAYVVGAPPQHEQA